MLYEVITERFQFEAKPCQVVKAFLHQGRLLEIEFKDGREEKYLTLDPPGGELGFQTFESDPLMGGVLVDENQIVAVLAYDIVITSYSIHYTKLYEKE